MTIKIDWTDPKAHVSKHFTVKEATYLPRWDVCHLPSDQEKHNIIELANRMDVVREFLKKPISIHVWIRPVLNNPASIYHGLDYNKLIGGAVRSAHKVGKGCDWDCGELGDVTRLKLVPMLETWLLRMEDLPGANWIHLDDMPVPAGGHRFFKP